MTDPPDNRRRWGWSAGPVPLSDASYVVNRLEEAGFTRTQADTLVRAVNAMVREAAVAASDPEPPPRPAPAASLPVLQGAPAATAGELRRAFARHRMWLRRMMLAWLMTNVLILGVAGTVLCLLLPSPLFPSAEAVAPYSPVVAGLVVLVFGLVVSRLV